MVDFNTEPEFDSVVQSLYDKTISGKIQWTDTAAHGTYLAAVKGQQTFEISRCHVPPAEDSEDYFVGIPLVTLTVRGFAGEILYTYSCSGEKTDAMKLYRAVERVVTKLDEHVKASVKLIQSL